MKTKSDLRKIIELSRKLQNVAKKENGKILLNSIAKASDLAAFLFGYENWNDALKNDAEVKILSKQNKIKEDNIFTFENNKITELLIDENKIKWWQEKIANAYKYKEKEFEKEMPLDIVGNSNKFELGTEINALKIGQSLTIENNNLMVISSDINTVNELFNEFLNFGFKCKNNITLLGEKGKFNQKTYKINILSYIIKNNLLNVILDLDSVENEKQLKVLNSWLDLIYKLHDKTNLIYSPDVLLQLCNPEYIWHLNCVLNSIAEDFLKTIEQNYEFTFSKNNCEFSKYGRKNFDDDFSYIKSIISIIKDEYDNGNFTHETEHTIESIIYQRQLSNLEWESTIGLEMLLLACHDVLEKIEKKSKKQGLNPVFYAQEIVIPNGAGLIRYSIIKKIISLPSSMNLKISLNLKHENWVVLLPNFQQILFMKNFGQKINDFTNELSYWLINKTAYISENIAFNNFEMLEKIDNKKGYFWNKNKQDESFSLKKIKINVDN